MPSFPKIPCLLPIGLHFSKTKRGAKQKQETNYVQVEIPRHWRTTHQRIRLEGQVCLKCDQKIFPPKPKHECDKSLVFDSRLLFSPNNQVVHSVVVREKQKQDDKSQN